jgi:hypothetical protein
MSVTIDGSGTITGISAGGYPDASVTPADLSQPFTAGTSVASTSGTSIDFTGIPSWVKRITVMFDGVSLNSSGLIRIQLGDSGGVETTGYTGASSYAGASNTAGAGSYSSGFDSFGDNNASVARYGAFYISKITGNTWCITGGYGVSTPSIYTMQFAGTKTLSDTLDRVRITSSTGTDTFDAGTINILYE